MGAALIAGRAGQCGLSGRGLRRRVERRDFHHKRQLPIQPGYPAQITNGRVGLASGEGGYAISGAVSGSGGIVVTVSQSGQSATGRGRLSRSGGGGKWRTADGQRSGTWVAERRS